MTTVRIFNVQHFSLHDGPGMRTTIFFKGCSLRCQWCANPESQLDASELLYDGKLCLQCGDCLRACPHAALTMTASGVKRDHQACVGCFACAEACRPGAMHTTGSIVTVDELVRQVTADAVFYRRGGGGVTLSGGEPLLQAEAARELLTACRARNISTAVETCCQAPWQAFELVLPYVNYWYCDIKQMDTEQHRRYTGMGNELILDNIRRLAERGVEMTIRYPYIPGINDSSADLAALALWMKGYAPGVKLELMPYHRYGTSKYVMLDRPYGLDHILPPSTETITEVAAMLRAQGINCMNAS